MKAFYTKGYTKFVSQLMGGMAIALLSSSMLSSSAIAKPAKSDVSQLLAPIEFVPPVLPDRGRPRGRSNGTASRGSCDLVGQLPLTALVPVTQVVPEVAEADPFAIDIAYDSVFSLTTQASPTFWFYVPYLLSETPLEFVLQNEQNQTLYQARYQPTTVADEGGAVDDENGVVSESGVVRVQIPEGEVALEVGDRYHWFFMAYCDENDPSFVEGWTERVPDASALSVESVEATPREQARMYAQQGVWQDAITLLGEPVLGGETEMMEDWMALLSSIGFEAIAQQPLVDCCEL